MPKTISVLRSKQPGSNYQFFTVFAGEVFQGNVWRRGNIIDTDMPEEFCCQPHVTPEFLADNAGFFTVLEVVPDSVLINLVRQIDWCEPLFGDTPENIRAALIAALPLPPTAVQLAEQTFCDSRVSQWPTMEEVKREGDSVYHLIGEDWILLLEGTTEQSDDLMAALKTFCDKIYEDAMEQQRYEIRAERRNEEILYGGVYF